MGISQINAAVQFWILPSLAIGVLPWLLETTRVKPLPTRRIRPLWYYLGAAVLGALVAVAAMAITRGANDTILLIPGSVILVSAMWIGAFSRPSSFDPFLGAWCSVNGICAVYTIAYPDEGDLAGLGLLMIWSLIGLPLAAIALVIAAILHRRPAGPDPENQGSGPESVAVGE